MGLKRECKLLGILVVWNSITKRYSELDKRKTGILQCCKVPWYCESLKVIRDLARFGYKEKLVEKSCWLKTIHKNKNNTTDEEYIFCVVHQRILIGLAFLFYMLVINWACSPGDSVECSWMQ